MKTSNDLVSKSRQTPPIISNAVVMIITNKYLIQLRYNVFQFIRSH